MLRMHSGTDFRLVLQGWVLPQRDRAVYKQLVALWRNALKEQLILKTQHSIWRRWLLHKSRSLHDLVDLYSQPDRYDVGFGARALLLLLAPDLNLVQPFVNWDIAQYGASESLLTYYSLDCSKIPDRLIGWCAVLIELFAGWVHQHPERFGDRARWLLIRYSQIIRGIHSRANPELAERMFLVYDLGTPVYGGMEDMWWPFEDLMLDPLTPREWRARANQHVQQLIVEQLSYNGILPRDDELILPWFIYTLERSVDRTDGSRYDWELIMAQIAFLLELEWPDGVRFIDTHTVASVYLYAADRPELSSIRRQLVESSIAVTNLSRFGVYDERMLSAAQRMLSEDWAVATLDAIRIAITAYNQRTQECDEERRREHQGNEAMLALMRPRTL
ncbi:hypothetical protein HGA91_03305 [candidate division WWE3 bacterium]|nr:hypothetical protein [candidate division WWE3 bacterium]